MNKSQTRKLYRLTKNMICTTCKIPMKTENDSQTGFADDRDYYTEEIKVCLLCGRRVRESYRTMLLMSLKSPMEDIKSD